MAREKWYDSDSPTRLAWGFGRWFATIFIVITIFSMLVTAAGWAFGVWTAPWKGRGEAYKKQQSAVNRVFAQQQFHDLNEDYQATLAKLPVYRRSASTSYQAQVNYQGLVSHCMDVVAEYNAASKKYLTKDFKDYDLPVTLSPAACG